MDVLVAGTQTSPPIPTAALVARQLDAHLAATYGISGRITAAQRTAVLRLDDLCVWVDSASGEITWSTGERDEHGRTLTASVPMGQSVLAADRIVTRYWQVRGLAGDYSVRIG
ncbi:hypothetical protein [Planotetraspora mira]|uniref:Uncharacterized protein n=1 Tax=Planotetraspora mira TaxID=58121 RepID=A0A8J3U222_9ACTN|nr:hypothetical protein [Planotetraspora mira]GII34619.1 hypothetical protein Pmi06nite_80610 [Planotetraspora mira]